MCVGFVRLLFLFLIDPVSVGKVLEIDLMGVEFRTINTGKPDFVAYRGPMASTKSIFLPESISSWSFCVTNPLNP